MFLKTKDIHSILANGEKRAIYDLYGKIEVNKDEFLVNFVQVKSF
jgi:hypothetical protein